MTCHQKKRIIYIELEDLEDLEEKVVLSIWLIQMIINFYKK